ncbi:MAG: AAA family ATPase, partial [Candidatus Aminicenantes bacterium]|nr:AAA family ATPase [Candidatus Aminicenantes bacterium]
MSLKIENIYVNNYKSFHDDVFKFDDFNIIVGANNAGKSNFLDLLEFIDNALRTDLITAVKEKGGFKKIKNFRGKDDFIEIKVDLRRSWSTYGWHVISSSNFY